MRLSWPLMIKTPWLYHKPNPNHMNCIVAWGECYLVEEFANMPNGGRVYLSESVNEVIIDIYSEEEMRRWFL